jgi:hypothetical protein
MAMMSGKISGNMASVGHTAGKSWISHTGGNATGSAIHARRSHRSGRAMELDATVLRKGRHNAE